MPRLARDDQVVAVDLRALWRALWQDVSWVLVKVFFVPGGRITKDQQSSENR